MGSLGTTKRFVVKRLPATGHFLIDFNYVKIMGSKKIVQFDAHKNVKREQEVVFKTKNGKVVNFEAKKTVKIPEHVIFRAKNK